MERKYLVLFAVLAVTLPLASLITKQKFEKVHKYAMAKVKIILFVLNSMNDQLHMRIKREVGEDIGICEQLLIDLPQMNYENHTAHQAALEEKMEDLVVGLTNLGNVVVQPDNGEHSDVATMKDLEVLSRNIPLDQPEERETARIAEKNATAKLKIILYIMNYLENEYARVNIHADDKADADDIKKEIGDAKTFSNQLLVDIPRRHRLGRGEMNGKAVNLLHALDYAEDNVTFMHTKAKHTETTLPLLDVTVLKDLVVFCNDLRNDIEILDGGSIPSI